MVEGGGGTKAPRMVPCTHCGLLFTSGSLRFHEKACNIGETPPPMRSPSARSELVIVTPPNAMKMTSLDGSGMGEGELEPLFDHTVRENDFDAVLFPESSSPPPSPSPSPPPPPHPLESAPGLVQTNIPPPYCKSDTGTISPGGESRKLTVATPTASPISSPGGHQIENSNIATAGPTTVATLHDSDNGQPDLDFGAETASPQRDDLPDGYIGSSTYDRQSPLTTCVLVDGELAPILPAAVETPIASQGWEAKISSTSTQQPSPKVTFAATVTTDVKGRRRSCSSVRSRSRSVGRSASPSRRRESSASVNSNSRTVTPDVVSLSVHRSELSKLRHALTQHRKLAEEKLTKERESFRIRLQKEKEEWQQSERAKERHASRQEKAEKELISALHFKLDEAAAINSQQAKELKNTKNSLRVLESEKSSLKTAKRTLTMEVMQMKESLAAAMNSERSQTSSISKKDVQLIQQEMSKVKAELARERNKTAKLQQVMKSRQAQQRSSSELMVTSIEQREQKVAEDEQRLAAEREAVASQKQKNEELSAALEQKQHELDRGMEQVTRLRGVAVAETSEIAALQRQVAGQQQFLEDRSSSLEIRMQQLTTDADRQTAELKRINREKERLEAHQEMIKQREQQVLERERALGASSAVRKSPTRLLRATSPSITSVIPVGIMSPSVSKRAAGSRSGDKLSAPPPPPPPSATSGKHRSTSFLTESDAISGRAGSYRNSRSYSSNSRESEQKVAVTTPPAAATTTSAFRDVTNIINTSDEVLAKYQPLKKRMNQMPDSTTTTTTHAHPHERVPATEEYSAPPAAVQPAETNIALLRKERGMGRGWAPTGSGATTPRSGSGASSRSPENENIVTRIVRSDLMRKKRPQSDEITTESEFSYDVTYVGGETLPQGGGHTAWRTPTSSRQLRVPA